jgi:hypothetical protein
MVSGESVFQGLEEIVRPDATGFQGLEKTVCPNAIGFQCLETVHAGKERSMNEFFSRVVFLVCCSVCVAALLLPVSAACAPAATLYVSPQGNDAWTGRMADPAVDKTDGPFATVSRAQEFVREMKRSEAGLTAPVNIFLRGGVYRLSRPLVFTEEDSGTERYPVCYQAYPGEEPVISGGTVVGGWEQEGDLWKTSIPLGREFNQLFVNGARRTRARIPNKGAFLRTDFRPSGSEDSTRSFYFKAGDLENWSNLSDAIVVVYHSWETSIHHISTLDLEARRVSFREKAPWGFGDKWEQQQRYYVENVFEGLDEPGEWYLNRESGMLYYYPMPDESMETAATVAPLITGPLVEFAGDPAAGSFVEHLHFKGISFQHSNAQLQSITNPKQAEIHQSGLIQARGLRKSGFEDCEITHAGAHGIWLGAGCSDNGIERCHLHDLGGGGVYIGGGWGVNDEFPAGGTVVDNNFIHDGSALFHGAHGVWIGKSSNNRITHNEISNFDYTGISCGWSWNFQPSTANHNAIEYNHIHHLGNGDGLSDMGGVYTLGVSPGTTIRHNHIHDIYSYEHVSYASGIYFDQGSSDILAENNLVYNIRSCPLFMHFGANCVVRNNILAFGGLSQVHRCREDQRSHWIIERNIIYSDTAPILDGPWTDGDWRIGNNLYWSTAGNPIFAGMDFDQWKEAGNDAGSVVADPLFADPENGDFSLQMNSPAFAQGFQPIDISRAGLVGDSEWTGFSEQFPNRPLHDVPPPPERPVDYDFEADAAGLGPAFGGKIVTNGGGDSVLVDAQTAAGGNQSLRFTDAPGQPRKWAPHLCCTKTFSEGTVRLSFDLRNSPEAPAGIQVILRQYDGASYINGLVVAVDPDGSIAVNNVSLGAIASGEWVHVEADIGLGSGFSGTCRVVLNGQEPAARELPLMNPEFQRIDWVGILSTSDAATVFNIDNLKMGTLDDLFQKAE